MKLRYPEAFIVYKVKADLLEFPFLRTFGCNFKLYEFWIGKRRAQCEMKNLKTVLSTIPEVKALLDDGVLNKVNKFEDLSIIHTGCDTYASIYPEFKKYMMDRSIDEVVIMY